MRHGARPVALTLCVERLPGLPPVLSTGEEQARTAEEQARAAEEQARAAQDEAKLLAARLAEYEQRFGKLPGGESR